MDHADFHEKLRERTLKITPQRVAIYREVCHSKEHPSIEMIYKKIKKKFPRISFDTVYRTLLTFSETGLLKPVESYGYTKRFDPNTAPHHHVHCIRCRRIMDFTDRSCDKIRVPEAVSKQFQLVSKKIVLEGICKKCLSLKPKT